MAAIRHLSGHHTYWNSIETGIHFIMLSAASIERKVNISFLYVQRHLDIDWA